MPDERQPQYPEQRDPQSPAPLPAAAAVPAPAASPQPNEGRPGGQPCWMCGLCDRELVPKKVVFEYLGHSVSHEVPACPQCGKVLISRDLAEGRMGEVEQTLEDK
jgi:YgiT-type zinc finger domain-containing protein